MEEITKLANEKFKETQETANNSTIGEFLIKTHDETFNNLDIISHEMAIIPIKRYLTLTAESDGIDLILKLGGELLFKDENFKQFIIKMNEYFDKIKSDPEYNTVEEYKYNEELIYDKFTNLLKKFD